MSRLAKRKVGRLRRGVRSGLHPGIPVIGIQSGLTHYSTTARAAPPTAPISRLQIDTPVWRRRWTPRCSRNADSASVPAPRATRLECTTAL